MEDSHDVRGGAGESLSANLMRAAVGMPIGQGGSVAGKAGELIKQSIVGEDAGNTIETISDGPEIRKPTRDEPIMLCRTEVITLRLLRLTHSEGGHDIHEFYHVSDCIAELIPDRLATFRAIPYYSQTRCDHAIWLLAVTNGGYYRSIQRVLLRSDDFFSRSTLLIHANVDRGVYVVRAMQCAQSRPPMPAPICDMLAEAIGASNFITSTDHPVIRQLTAGEVLS